jgi:hypothetical protein
LEIVELKNQYTAVFKSINIITATIAILNVNEQAVVLKPVHLSRLYILPHSDIKIHLAKDGEPAFRSDMIITAARGDVFAARENEGC